MQFTVNQGMNQNILKQYTDNHFDSIVTDPPYGIEFLGKDWDSNTGAIETWKECYRVLKPGGHLLAFSAARTYHHLATNIENCGFEIRDQLMWIYASGFPKAQAMKNHPGWKTALKPGHEPIVMARKPFSGSTYANMDRYGVGAVNIDASRIPYDGESDFDEYVNNIKGPLERSKAKEGDNIGMYEGKTGFKRQKGKVVLPSGGANGLSRLTFGEGETSNEDSFKSYTPNQQGRYPSNVMGEITDYQKYFYCPKVTRAERHCGFEIKNIATGNNIGDGVYEPGTPGYTQDGTLGRMKDKMHKPQVGNNHPTVKPVALMRYLVELVTPKGGSVLDPFCGSGSTGMACVEADMSFTGCESDPNYVAIARKRIEAWQQKTQPNNNFKDLFDAAD
jgi:site-specific DNA-methyltransferase (adenine-specific)